MMEVKTGYFAYTKKYMQAGYYPISVARYSPKWFTGEIALKLAPSKHLFEAYKQGSLTVDEFRARYLDNLDIRWTTEAVIEWNKLCMDKGYKGIVLLCYEKLGDVCHRHFLAEFLNVRYSLGVEELVL